LPHTSASHEIAVHALAEMYAAGSYRQVETGAAALIRENPGLFAAHLLLAHAYLSQNMAVEAREAFHRALRIEPQNAQSHTGLARALIFLGEFHAAMESCRNALQADPLYWDAEVAMADALLELGHWKKAADRYRKVLAADEPPIADVFLGLGISLQRLGRLTESLEWFERAINLDPDHDSGYCNFANSLAFLGKSEEAIEYYQRAMAISPGTAALHVNLASAYLGCGRLENAIACSRRALELAPPGSNPASDLVSDEAHGLLGDALRYMGRFEEAFHHYKMQQVPNDAGKALECAYLAGHWTEYQSLLESLSEDQATNIRAAAVSNFVALQRKDAPSYSFCPKPMAYIRHRNIAALFGDFDNFCTSLLDEASVIDSVWNPPGNSTHGGFQSSENLFNLETPRIDALERILKACIQDYFGQFQDSIDPYVSRRPQALKLSGWIVRLRKSGRQEAHIHPSGWLSGVLYLRVPDFRSKEEGAISFQMSGYDYPPGDDPTPQTLYQPSKGDLVLFPSCLFHKTLPFDMDEERISVAFDLQPDR
jgi:uncharacterized protein (TIGR02466 family)